MLVNVSPYPRRPSLRLHVVTSVCASQRPSAHPRGTLEGCFKCRVTFESYRVWERKQALLTGFGPRTAIGAVSRYAPTLLAGASALADNVRVCPQWMALSS